MLCEVESEVSNLETRKESRFLIVFFYSLTIFRKESNEEVKGCSRSSISKNDKNRKPDKNNVCKDKISFIPSINAIHRSDSFHEEELDNDILNLSLINPDNENQSKLK